MEQCKKGNHVIGCGSEGHTTMHGYIDEGRKHPGYYFNFCPECGERLINLDEMADRYQEENSDDFDFDLEPYRKCMYCGQESCDCDML